MNLIVPYIMELDLANNILEDIHKRLKEKGLIVHCSTKEDLELMISIIEYFNFYCRLTSKNWDRYRENTCVCYDHYESTSYCSVEFFQKEYPRTKILEYNSENYSKSVFDLIKNIMLQKRP